MAMHAARAGTDGAGGVLAIFVLFGIGYLLLSFFFRRVGGKGGGSEKASVGAWILFAAIFVGILVATGR